VACARVFVCIHSYEIHYSGVETLDTLRAPRSQPFYAARRKLHLKLKWDFTVERDYKTGAVDKRQAIVSGTADLTIPDNPSLDCTSPLRLSPTDANLWLDGMYVNPVAGPKALVWTEGLPRRAAGSCSDSSPAPLFTSSGFQARYNAAAQPRFSVACTVLNNGGGTWSEKFNFDGASRAELSTVGLGKVDVTITSTVTLKRLKCSTATLHG
jgi:hypothetical protein